MKNGQFTELIGATAGSARKARNFLNVMTFDNLFAGAGALGNEPSAAA